MLAAGLLAASLGLRAQSPDEKPYLVKSFPADGFKSLRMLTSGGNVTVTGQSSGEARIEMYVRASNWDDKLSDAEIKERLEKYYEVEISKDATSVNATAKRRQDVKWAQENGLSISFRAYVPMGVATDLKTSGGNVSMENLNGQQTAATSGGNIEVKNVKGNATVRTSGGNIEVDGFNGTLDAITSGGNIEAEDAKGGLKLRTSGGNLELSSVSGNLEAQTSGGNIEARITELGERISLTTSSGDVDVKMPLDQGMDLDLKGNEVKINMKNFKGVVEDDRVQGKLNGGGIPVTISTSSGNVDVN
jgi:DUF4097 and DUF4098 domain-containing protein YvlB